MLTIWTITVVLLIEATKMLIRGDQRVHGAWMLGVALVGLVFNLIQMRILHSKDLAHYRLDITDE